MSPHCRPGTRRLFCSTDGSLDCTRRTQCVSRCLIGQAGRSCSFRHLFLLHMFLTCTFCILSRPCYQSNSLDRMVYTLSRPQSQRKTLVCIVCILSALLYLGHSLVRIVCTLSRSQCLSNSLGRMACIHSRLHCSKFPWGIPRNRQQCTCLVRTQRIQADLHCCASQLGTQRTRPLVFVKRAQGK